LEKLYEAAWQHGIWALLFVALFVWVLKQNEKRENRYIQVIETQAVAVSEVSAVRTCVDEARKDIEESKRLLGRVLDRLPAKE
jgi:hypothetical protein